MSTAEQTNKGFAENSQSELDKTKPQGSQFKEKAKEVGNKAYRGSLHAVNGVGKVAIASARVVILTMVGIFLVETIGMGALIGLGAIIAGGAALVYGSHGLLHKEWKTLNAFA